MRVELLAAQSRRLRQAYTLFLSGSMKGKQVSVVHSAVMVLLATPSNGSPPPCTTGKRCSSGHVIRPGTPPRRRLGSSICWFYVFSDSSGVFNSVRSIYFCTSHISVFNSIRSIYFLIAPNRPCHSSYPLFIVLTTGPI